MIVGQALKKYSRFEIELLLAHVLKKPKEFLFLNPKYKLSSHQAKKLLSMVGRRAKGEPAAYILGYKDFMGLRFIVSKNVLIPRPETEWVVQEITSRVKAQKRQVKILDVGTGSGCIAISLAKGLQGQAQVCASDVSGRALVVARKNAKMLRARVKFIQSDLLMKVKFSPEILVANLPYGWHEWENNSSAETLGLKFEPRKALFTKEGGLLEIRRLLVAIAKMPKPPKSVYLEFDPRQKKALSNLAKKNLPKYRQIFHKDYSNFWRYLELAGYQIIFVSVLGLTL
jgi:release factor glutamine methyltransferase